MTEHAAPSTNGLPRLDPCLAEMLEEQAPQWLATAWRVCGGDRQFAEDAVTEAVYALNRELLAGAPVDNPAAWFQTALRNRASARIRAEKTQQRIKEGLANTLPTATPTLSDGDDETQEPWLLTPEHLDQVRDLLPQLPPRQREVIRMRLFEKKTPSEIAEQLGCAEGTIHAAQNMAVKNLRKLLTN